MLIYKNRLVSYRSVEINFIIFWGLVNLKLFLSRYKRFIFYICKVLLCVFVLGFSDEWIEWVKDGIL